MPNVITFEGDMVRVESRELVRELRLQDFLPHIEHRPPVTLGILPKTAIIIHWDESAGKDKKAQVFAELTAGMYTCTYAGRKYNLSIPWTYFLLDFDTSGDPMEGRNWVMTNSRLYWSRAQVTNLDQELMTALVPNVDHRGQICWGTTGVDGALSLGVRVDRTVHEFYHTEFTHTNGAGSPWDSETGNVDNWKKWADESKTNPAAFLNFPEWDHAKGAMLRNAVKYPKVREVIGSLSDRSAPIEVIGKVPEMVSPMTFGRAEELVRDLDPTDVYRLKVAIQNLEAENPAIAVEPPVVDLGGEPVDA